VALYQLNCYRQCIFGVQDTKYKQKRKVQELPAQGRKVLGIRIPGSKWYQNSRIEVSLNLMTFNCQRSKHQGDPKRTRQADTPVISEYTNWKKKTGGGKGKKKYSTRQCKVCAAHKKQSETRYIFKFCIVLLHKEPCFENDELLDYLHAVSAIWGSGV
jgi:hypothetical protein